MLPVVRGDRETKVQMLIYTLILLPLTILPAFFGAFGLLYAVAAVALGARFLWYNFQLLREDGVTPTAWKMYKYSLVYLALLFLAMSVDRSLPRAAQAETPEVLLLAQPATTAGPHGR
jgi:protoheme IX farnesyltransferase